MTWENELGPDDKQAWDDFVAYQREHVVQAMAESAFVMSLVPKGETDIKFAVELGLSIMLDKPVLAVVMPGVEVPEKLLKVADLIVYADIDTEEGRRVVSVAVENVLAGLGES